MADNDQLLQAIESIKSDVGNIKKDMASIEEHTGSSTHKN
jgi:hypothetical protein